MVAFLALENPASYQTTSLDQDGLWKKVIGDLFEEFLSFFDPHLHEHVDFSALPGFLQQEVFQEVADEKKGRRRADQIVKVRLKDGNEQWILIHVEMQSEYTKEFSERMFQYFYRIYDRYDQKIVAYAILTALDRRNSPDDFRYNYFGTSLHYEYTTRRLVDYDKMELERSDQLFSKIVLAAKYLHETEGEDSRRFLFKKRLMRVIIRNPAYSPINVQAALHFVDYLLRLPKELTERLSNDLRPMLRKEEKLMELYQNKENASPTIVNAFERERIEGKLEERKTIAREMLANDFSVETIMTLTKLTKEEVSKLQQEIQ